MHLPEIRGDLEATSRVINGEAAVIVSDPILGAYHQFDELQWEIAKQLDGHHTLADVSRIAGDQFGAEVPVGHLAQFVDQLRSLGLLTVSNQQVAQPAVARRICRQVQKQLRRLGVSFTVRRRERRVSPRNQERRRSTEEASLFDHALCHLEAARPVEASRALDAVLEMNPGNVRARLLYRVIQEAVLTSRERQESALYFRIPIVSPDRFLAPIARHTRFLLSPSMAWLIVGAFLWGLLSSTSHLDLVERELRALVHGERHVASVLVFNWAYVAVITLGHELSHALVTKLHGGRVPKAGILVQYLMTSAFADVSDSYRFDTPWKRASVALAGPCYEAIWFGVWGSLLWVVTPGTFLASIAVLLSVLHFIRVVSCSDFLIKNDGYFALVELLGIPNLRDRAITYATASLSRRLGLSSDMPEATPRERRIFLAMGAPAVVWAAVRTLLQLWASYLFLVGAWRGAGLVVFALVATFALRQVVGDAVRTAWRRREELTRSKPVRAFAVGALLFLVALAVFRRPVRVEGTASILAADRTTLTAPYPGVLQSVDKEEGDRVEAGEIVAQMDVGALGIQARVAAANVAALSAEIALLKAGARREEVDAAETARKGLAAKLAYVSAHEARLVSLGPELSAGTEVEEARKQESAAFGDLRDVEARLRLLRAKPLIEALAMLEADLAAAKGDLERIEDQIRRGAVRSPMAGRVYSRLGKRGEVMSGAYVSKGDALLVVARADTEAEIAVPPSEPQRLLHRGCLASVRLDGLPDSELHGEVVLVSPAADPSTGALRVRVALGAGTFIPEAASGRARIFAEPRSLMYQATYPIRRYFSVEFWSIL